MAIRCVLGRRVTAIIATACIAMVGLVPNFADLRAQAQGNELTIVVGAEPVSLHPNEVNDAASEAIVLNMYETLVMLGPTGEIEPLLAASWEQVDPLTYRFNIRQGVTFHDGSALTAEDVVATINEVVNPASDQPYRSQLYVTNVTEATSEGEYVVVVKTSAPFGPFLRNMTQLRITAVESQRDALLATPNGTGAYQLVEYTAGSHITLERFDGYWGTSSNIDRVTFRVVPESSGRVAEAQTGGAQIVTNIPPELVSVAEGIDGMNLVVSPTTYRISMTYNATTDTPVSNPLVRQAINYAIDYQAIIDNILLGYGSQVGPLIEQDFGYDPAFADYGYDPQRSMELLAEAGYADGFDVVIATPQGRYLKDREVSDAVAGMLNEVGIRATVQVYEFGTLIDNLAAGTIDPIYLIGWRGVNFDPSTALTHWECKAGFSNYCVEAMDAALTAGVSSAVEEERLAAYRNALALYLENPPGAYVFQESTATLVSESIEWTPRIDQLILVRTMTFV